MFYISSQGHSATGWLASALSMHPEIVCWHGTRGIPPYPSGRNDISPEDFVNGLIQCERGCLNQKVFGACHGYYGTILKQYVEKNKGVFMGIVRNPIMRVNSIFQAFAAVVLTDGVLPTDTKIDIYSLIREKENLFDDHFSSVVDELRGNTSLKKFLYHMNLLPLLRKYRITDFYWNTVRFFSKKKITDREREIKLIMKGKIDQIDLKMIKNILTDDELAQRVIANFLSACDRTFTSDSVITRECERKSIIKMEEMTISPKYFNSKIFIKLMNCKADDKYLNQVFRLGDNINKHSSFSKRPTDIFESWPRAFRHYFMNALLSCDAKKTYEEYDYEIPGLR